jgi:hypothetical protein
MPPTRRMPMPAGATWPYRRGTTPNRAHPAERSPFMSAATASFQASGLNSRKSESGLPRHALRRGTRGFGAFVLGLAGFVVLGVGAVVLPNLSFDRIAMSWLIPLTVAFGIGHFVAAFGLIRRRVWSTSLTGYVAAIGIGVAAYGLLVTMTGLDPFGATSSLPGDQARAEGIGLLIWMIGLWLVGFRAARAAVPEQGTTPWS